MPSNCRNPVIFITRDSFCTKRYQPWYCKLCPATSRTQWNNLSRRYRLTIVIANIFWCHWNISLLAGIIPWGAGVVHGSTRSPWVSAPYGLSYGFILDPILYLTYTYDLDLSLLFLPLTLR